jgi:hypothetical protein
MLGDASIPFGAVNGNKRGNGKDEGRGKVLFAKEVAKAT